MDMGQKWSKDWSASWSQWVLGPGKWTLKIPQHFAVDAFLKEAWLLHTVAVTLTTTALRWC